MGSFNLVTRSTGRPWVSETVSVLPFLSPAFIKLAYGTAHCALR